MVLEHEYMHQETLLYMMQQTAPGDKVRPRESPILFRACRTGGNQFASQQAKRGWARVSMISLSVGTMNSVRSRLMCRLHHRLVAGYQWRVLEFVLSGAYVARRYWRAEDWRWKNLEKKHHPTCWVEQPTEMVLSRHVRRLSARSSGQLAGLRKLGRSARLCAWRGKRLPTEAEYQRAAFYGPDERETPYPWGDGADARHGNFDFTAWSPAPVGSHPTGASRWGVHELVGNGWELTDTPFAPLPGFTPYMTSYPDYSKDFFDGKHFVVKGASWATDARTLAAELSQLVSSPLSLCVCQVSLCRG